MPSREDVDDQQETMANDDPIENFFRRLPVPGPDTWSYVAEGTDAVVTKACELLVEEAITKPSTDPDFRRILQYARKTIATGHGTVCLYSQLITLVFEKNMGMMANTTGTSHKLRHLGFLCWMAQGHRAETLPVAGVTGTTGAFLPENGRYKTCAGCGEPNAATRCSGCLIRHGDSITFATAYCSKECHNNDCKTHKATCQQIQRFQRAASIFQEIFEHSFSTAFPVGRVENIAVEDGMLSMTVNRSRHNPADTMGWYKTCPFPRHLAPTPEAAMAAMMNGNCPMVLLHHRPLFEMLIRPTCTHVLRFHAFPKNIQTPCRMVYTDCDRYTALLLHEIVWVRLPGDARFVMDATAMQFGWRETVAPALDYTRHRVQRFAAPDEVPAELPGTLAAGRAPPLCGVRRREDGIMQTLVLGLLPQIEARFGGVEGLLRLKGPEFEVARVAVMDAAKRGLDLLTEEINAGMDMEIIADPIGTDALAGLGIYNRVELVWYEMGDKTLSKRKVEKLRQRWRARWEKVVKIELPSENAV